MKARVTASSLRIRSLPEATPFTDTGMRFAEGEVLTTWGTSHDGAWVYAVAAPDRAGWTSLQYLQPVVDASVSGEYPPVPKTRAAVSSIFGAAGSPAASAGRVILPAPLKLGWAQQVEVTRVACHVKMVAPFTDAFNQIHAAGLWPKLKTFDGIYNDRTIKGSSNKSMHAYGAAIDLNAATNQMGRKGDMPAAVVKIFEDIGFVWGGRFSRTDPMHFAWGRF